MSAHAGCIAPAAWFRAAVLMTCIALAFGCGSTDEGGAAGGSGGSGGSGGTGGSGAIADPLCSAAPTYEDFAEPLVAARCLHCHSSARVGLERNGAPAGVDFDTEAMLLRHEDQVRVMVTEGRMPADGALEPCLRDNLNRDLDSVACTPDCDERSCGDDGCGGLCGTCAGAQDACDDGACVCQPDCDGRACGDDGCGGSCGVCAGAQDACEDGACVCQPDCDGRACGDDGCGGTCGVCAGAQELCVDGDCACQPACDGLACGDDGCGGTCGTCPNGTACTDGACVSTCTDTCGARECGVVCGVSCGSCTAPEVCNAGTCECRPVCTGRECGPDGCGGTCGTCTGNETCTGGQCQCVPQCSGAECGADGCGGSCGTCAPGEVCAPTDTCEWDTSVTFAADVFPILSANCSSCHSGPSPQNGLGFDDVATAYANLVNVAASGCASQTRVVPGSPGTSHLVRKLEGTAVCGARMPYGGAPLPAATIGTVKAWIANGAQND